MGPNLKGHRNIARSVLTKYSPSLLRVTTGGAGATKKRSIETALFVFIICGAEGETRTRTGRPPLDPEPSASTNSATSACIPTLVCLIRRSRVALNIFFYYACQGHTLIDRE